jgi:hypothetical protein
MKHTIYTLHCDTDAGNDTFVYGNKQELRAEIEGIIANIYQDKADMLAALSSMDCKEWREEYSDWREAEADAHRYYSRQEHTIEIPDPRIVITVEGGVIQSILSSVPVDVLTIDYDVDGSDSRRLVEVPQEGLGERRTELAHVMIDSAGSGLNEPARVNELFALLDTP